VHASVPISPRTGSGYARGLLIASLVLAGCSVPPVGWPSVSPGDSGVTDSGVTDGGAAFAGSTVTGRVLDPTGLPVVDAHVVLSPHGYEATTDADGAFRVDRLPAGTYEVMGVAEGWDAASVPVTLAEGEEVDLEVQLSPKVTTAGDVEVEVRAPDSKPVEGAVVTTSAGTSAVTDAAGRVMLTGLGGTTVSLEIADADGALWSRHVDDVAVVSAGGAQLAVTLGGRPADGALRVGTTVCSYCHTDIAAAWSQTAHGHSLGSSPDPALAARFSAGELVDLGTAQAFLTTSGGSPAVQIRANDGESRTYLVSGYIGDTRHGTVPTTDMDGASWPLPVGWVAADPGRPGFPDADERLVAGDIQGWLDGAGDFVFATSSTPDPALSAEARCYACHTTGSDLSLRPDGGVDMVASDGSGARWSEPDVGCERCHGPGSTHTSAGEDTRYSVITRADDLDADRANEVCGQCHSRTTSADGELPFPYASMHGTFRPGQDLSEVSDPAALLWSSQAAAAPGEQADEHALSGHGIGGLKCFDCHDPHGEATDSAGTPLPSLLRLEQRDNTLCNSCHLGLSFGGDESALEAHNGHVPYAPHNGYDPTGTTEMGRCTGCHMPGTTARLSYGILTGSGDLSSHRFLALAPQYTVDVFDSLGATVLPLGQFPANACLDCHAWNTWLADTTGGVSSGPSGDPTLLETHQRLQAAYAEKFP